MAFPQTPLPLGVALYLGATLGWVDVTADVRLSSAHSGGGVQITRGRQNEGGQADPGRCALVLNNRDGQYSPRNPRGAYYGLIGRNTPLRVGVQLATDAFGRTSSSGWGVTDDGQTWLSSGGLAADHTVSGGLGRHLQPVKDTVRADRLTQDWRDVEQVSEFAIPAIAVGAVAVVGHQARYNTTTGDHYWLRLEFDVAGAMTTKITQHLGGAQTELAAYSSMPGYTYTAGQAWSVRTSVSSQHLAIRAWPTGTPEPDTWTLETTDDAITAAGQAGVATWVSPGNINTTEISVDNYQAVSRRMVGEVSTWPTRWDIAGKDRWVPIEASGLLRRLNQGQPVLQSPLYRRIMEQSPSAYWPMEDPADSGMAVSPVDGVGPMRPFSYARFTTPITGEPVPAAGAPKFATAEGIPGSAPVVDLTQGGTLNGRVPVSTSVGWRIEWVMTLPRDKAAARIPISWTTDGAWDTWRMQVESTGIFATFEAAGVTMGSASIGTLNLFDGLPHHYRVQASTSGGVTSAGVYIDNTLVALYSAFVPPMTGSAGSIDSVVVNPLETTNGDESMPVAFGHVAVWNPAGSASTTSAATQGFGGETATTRMTRLASEESLPLVIVDADDDNVPAVGPQGAATLLDLLRECAAADGGILGEQRVELGLVYRTRATLYNQTPVVLSYSDGHIAAPFEPTEDDEGLANDVTVTRSGGSAYRAVQTAGRMSVEPPPDGVGRYDTSVALNLAADEQLPDQAAWRLWLGTVDEARYPRVRVDLSSSAWAVDPGLSSEVASVDSGDLLSLADLPEWLPPGPVLALAEGYTETLDAYDWDITWNASPGSPWTVATADGAPRAPAEGSTLAASITALAMTLSLASTATNGPWTTDPSDFPLDVLVGGEQVTASAIGPAVADTFTRTTSNGWGTAESGQAWTTSGGSASDYSVASGAGRHSVSSVNVLRSSLIDTGAADHLLTVDITLPVVPTGAGYTLWVVGRVVDLSNYYVARLDVATSGAAILQLVKRTSGTLSAALAPSASLGTHAAGNTWRVVFDVAGSTLRAKAWRPASETEPDWLMSATDTSLTTGTQAGVLTRAETGNANGTQVVTFDAVTVASPQLVTLSARGVNGVQLAWAAGVEVNVASPAVAPL